MKTWRNFLRPTLALLLALASVPAWACARPCDGRQEASLACVRLCAHSHSLLTQGGKFDSIGAQACGVNAQFSQPGLGLVEAAQAPVPGVEFVGVAQGSQLSPAQALPLAADSRGPPTPSLYLAFQHPTANGPPSLV